uniref:Immunoglobulin like and fibronectin type III domain containing 1, tandem duplicate 2 n=1 Tax=Amphiprion ocellaris TaxID=80972 RepID=A0A3Q1CTS2_AMPOC
VAKEKSLLLKAAKRSKTPGVMITQYVMNLPEGKSTPDFISKPTPLTIDEGKLAVFKAVVKGDPKPEVSWKRAKGNILEKQKFLSKYDESTGEYILEVSNSVIPHVTDTYKCHAVNEYGKAVWTTTLTVNEGKIFIQHTLKHDSSTNPADFRKLLKKRHFCMTDGESDEKFWDAMLNADRKDYERICSEFGVTDLHSILKKLEEKKKERAQNNFILSVTLLCTLQDGVSPYDEDEKLKNDPRSIGRTKHFSTNGLMQNGTGLYEGDVDEINLLSNVDFVIKIQETKAKEREDALFECVLTHPLSKITWMGKGSNLEDGEKYSITVSDHKLIHRLLIRDCQQLDKGIYSAVAGITTCSAWLVVEAESNLAGKKIGRKTTLAGGARIDLEKVAKEQQIKYRQEMEKILASVKAKHDGGQLKEKMTLTTGGGDGKNSEITEPDKNAGDIKDKSDTAKASAQPVGRKGKTKRKNSKGDGTVSKLDNSGCVTKADVQLRISPDDHFSIAKDGPIHKLVITKCVDEHSGKYRFEADGRKTEAMINVKDPPRFHPEDLNDFTEPVIIKVGHNAIFKLHFVGFKPIKIKWYREGEELHDDTNTKIEKCESRSLLLLSRCQRKDTGEIKIKLKNEHGFTEAVSQLIVLDKPTSPLGPAEVTESSAAGIEFKWRPPKDDGGSPVINYIMERQQVGRNTWKKIGEIPGVPCYRDTDVDRGRKYCYRIRAVTAEGTSEVMETDEMQAGTLAFPGPPAPPKVVSAFDDCINLSWAAPSNTGGSRILGYILEKRKKGSNLWTVVNAMDELIKEKKYAVKDVVEGMEYEFRVTAINLSGPGESSNPSEFVFARDPKMRPKFTNNKMKTFIVVRAGNSVRITVNFEASPRPDIMWLKDNIPVTKRVTISNSDGSSQLLIPSSERSDSGIYSILVKNLVGQETFSTEVRVTDDPKPPGPVQLEENVPETVTVIWEPSPDEKRDDRLHYTVSKLDSTKRTWSTVADRLFNNKFTVCNIMHGREYHFRVYAKNDMGISAPSESPTWGMEKKKCFVINAPTRRDCDLRCAPSFIVPLKLHSAPKGYECHMSCAVKGNPTPRITWYRNHVSLNTNTNYYTSNTCGVCSMLILRVGPKDMGEYTITAENSLGRAECSTVLSVQGERKHSHTDI